MTRNPRKLAKTGTVTSWKSRGRSRITGRPSLLSELPPASESLAQHPRRRALRRLPVLPAQHKQKAPHSQYICVYIRLYPPHTLSPTNTHTHTHTQTYRGKELRVLQRERVGSGFFISRAIKHLHSYVKVSSTSRQILASQTSESMSRIATMILEKVCLFDK